MIKLGKMTVKQPELDLIAQWRNESMLSLRADDLTAKGWGQEQWVKNMSDRERYYFIYDGNEFKLFNFIGYCGLDKIDAVNRTAEMGLLVKPDYQKQGYGTQAVRKLLEVGFNLANLNCIFIEVIATTQNWKFWKKQGFRHEGFLTDRFWKNKTFYSSHVASITRKEWKRDLLPKWEATTTES